MMETLDDIARTMGYTFMVVIALVLGSILLSIISYRVRGGQERDRSRSGRPSTSDGGIGKLVIEDVDEWDAADDLLYDPRPAANLDWSMNDPDVRDLERMTAALSDAGFYVHSFPDHLDEGWSGQHAGVWVEEPTWYVELDEGTREVTPTDPPYSHV